MPGLPQRDVRPLLVSESDRDGHVRRAGGDVDERRPRLPARLVSPGGRHRAALLRAAARARGHPGVRRPRLGRLRKELSGVGGPHGAHEEPAVSP